MTQDIKTQNDLSFAEIEKNLLEAEDRLQDANERIRIAQDEKNDALKCLNRYQEEFEKAYAKLQRRSSPGTHWADKAGTTHDALDLRAEDEVQVVDFRSENDHPKTERSESPSQKTARHFQLLRTQVGSIEMAGAGKN